MRTVVKKLLPIIATVLIIIIVSVLLTFLSASLSQELKKLTWEQRFVLTVLWLIGDVVIAFSPLIAVQFLNFLAKEGKKIGWLEMLEKADLFLFSTTLSGTSMTRLLEPSFRDGHLVFPVIGLEEAMLACGLILAFLFSAQLLAFTLTGAIDPKQAVETEIVLAFVAIVLSYSTFMLGFVAN